MEDKDLTQKIDAILQKRARTEQLTDEEESIVKDIVNKLLAGKKCVNKTVTIKTGEEIRKGDVKLPVSAKEPDRDFKGAFDSKIKIESTGDTPKPAKMPGQIRDEKLTDQKDEKVPAEDNSGDIKADAKKEEFADLDNKPRDINYEEDRMANIKEGQHDYKDSIRTGALVTKSYSGGRKMVGAIVKVYAPVKGQQAIMVKWSDGRCEPVNVREVELLEATEKGWRGVRRGAAAGAGLGALSGGLTGALVDARRGGGIPGVAAGAGLGAVVGAAQGIVPGSVIGGIAEGDSKPKKLKVKKDAEGKDTDDPEKVMESEDIRKPEDVEKKFEQKPTDSKDSKKPDVKDAQRPEDATAIKPEHEMQHRHLGEKHGLELQHLGEKHQLERDQTFPPQDVEQTDQAPVDQPQDEEQSTTDQLPEEPPQEWLDEVANTLRQLTDLSDEEIDQAARSAWTEIVAGHNTKTEELTEPAKPVESVKPVAFQAQKAVAAEDVEKAVMISSPGKPTIIGRDAKTAAEMLHTHVLPKKPGGKSPYEEMYATGKAHNKMASGDFEKTADGQTIVKITKEDLVDCPQCLKKMEEQKIKYYKFTF